MDGTVLQDCELERERLTKELEFHRQAVVKAVDQVHEIDIILDRTTKLYAKTLREQSQLIDRWRQSVFVLKQRDDAIQETIRVRAFSRNVPICLVYTFFSIYRRSIRSARSLSRRLRCLESRRIFSRIK